MIGYTATRCRLISLLLPKQNYIAVSLVSKGVRNSYFLCWNVSSGYLNQKKLELKLLLNYYIEGDDLTSSLKCTNAKLKMLEKTQIKPERSKVLDRLDNIDLFVQVFDK